ncbi:hypothetical protein [Acidicapsa ligni]|uniref:hypothetical protein n=1 Tax=Acidicapsa ligni TaxID=542300 RepID=UPI0021E09D91|nr:hypothetical protein [Acidicapsa ligni]
MFPGKSFVVLSALALCTLPMFAQTHSRHLRYPNTAANDPQLILPQDQAQSCYTPDSTRSGYEQFEQFDSFTQPASKGYLCINIPTGRTFVIDQLFAEADYDDVLPAGAEWYLDTMIGSYELMTGFAATRTGSSTSNPHYVLSQPVHMGVHGGSRVTLIMHSYSQGGNSSINETPGTGSLTVIGHWE